MRSFVSGPEERYGRSRDWSRGPSGFVTIGFTACAAGFDTSGFVRGLVRGETGVAVLCVPFAFGFALAAAGGFATCWVGCGAGFTGILTADFTTGAGFVVTL